MKFSLFFLVLEACATAAGGVSSVMHRHVDTKVAIVSLAKDGMSKESVLHRALDQPSYMFFVYGGVMLGIAVCVGGLAFAVGRTKAPEGEPAEAAEAATEQAGDVAPSNAEVNIEKLLKLLAKHAAQQVGPKLAKANKVKNVLEHRIFGFKNKAATFVMDELYGIVARVLRELEAEEAMLLFDPAAAASANLPPASILLAGLLSPIVLSISLVVHLSQVFLVLIPVLCMCAWALYTDWLTLEACAVPTISFWIYCQGGLSCVLLVSHLATTVQIQVGKGSIKDKMDSMQDRLREALSDGELSLDEIRELFIVSAILLEHSLVVEDRLRRSFWRTIIGYGTIAWMLMTLWTFIIVLGWTFIPGMVAFHPSAKDVAGDDFCGAWATVFTARLSCVLSLLFLIFNLVSVVQWLSDQMVTSDKYSALMIDYAKSFDDSAGGIPVMQTLIKAFLLRGNGDSIRDQLEQSYNRKYALQQQQRDLQAKVTTLNGRIAVHKSEAKSLKKAQGIPLDDDLDAVESAVTKSVSDMKDEAMVQAKALEKKTKEDLDAMYQKFVEAASNIQNSEVVQGAIAQAQQVQEGGIEGLQEAASSGLTSAQGAATAGYASAQDAAASAHEAAGSHLAVAQDAAASAHEAAGSHLAVAQDAATSGYASAHAAATSAQASATSQLAAAQEAAAPHVAATQETAGRTAEQAKKMAAAAKKR